MAAKTKEDAQLFELVTESLKPGNMDALNRIFLDHGARAPDVIWDPKRGDLRNSLLRQFHDTATRLGDENGTLTVETLQLEKFGQLMDWLMLVEKNADGEFTYLYYGRAIADAYGQDMSGKTVEAFGGHITSFFAALYDAVSERGVWAYSEHEPPKSVFVRSWHRLIVPLAGREGNVSRYLVMNVPENELSAGLELMVDPVFVIGEDKEVIYFNSAAQQLFKLSRKGDTPKSLEALTGIELDARMTPSEMLKARRREDSTELATRGAIVERLIVTTSAAQLRGSAYYVVVMRMLGA